MLDSPEDLDSTKHKHERTLNEATEAARAQTGATATLIPAAEAELGSTSVNAHLNETTSIELQLEPVTSVLTSVTPHDPSVRLQSLEHVSAAAPSKIVVRLKKADLITPGGTSEAGLVAVLSSAVADVKPVLDQQTTKKSAGTSSKKTISSYLAESEQLRQQSQQLQHQLRKEECPPMSKDNELAAHSFIQKISEASNKLGTNQLNTNGAKLSFTSKQTNVKSTNSPLKTRKPRTRKSHLASSMPISSNSKQPKATATGKKSRSVHNQVNNVANNSNGNSGISSSSSSNSSSNSSLTNNHNTSTNHTNSKLVFEDSQFTKTALFHTPDSLLTKLDLKALFQPTIFESLSRQSQLKLIKLLPDCDRQLDSHGSFKLNVGALNNEFIKKCCTEWQKKLSNGDFGNFNINSIGTGEPGAPGSDGRVNSCTTITRSTRLRQQKLLQSLKDTTDSGDEDDFFYYDEEDSLEAFNSSNFEQPTEPQRSLSTQQTNNSTNNKANVEEETALVYASTSASMVSSMHNESSSHITTEESSFDEDLEEFETSEDGEELGDNSNGNGHVELEYLENRKRLLHSEAKRLLKKNKKLRKNYSLTAENIIVKTSNANGSGKLPVGNGGDAGSEAIATTRQRRQRRPQALDTDYVPEESDESGQENEVNKSHEKLIVQPIEINSGGEQKLRLRIKRIPITTTAELGTTPATPELRIPKPSSSGSLTIDTTTITSPNTPGSKKSFDHSLISELNVIRQPPMISPDTRLTRRTAAILKNSPAHQTPLTPTTKTAAVGNNLLTTEPRNISEISNKFDLYDTQEEEDEDPYNINNKIEPKEPNSEHPMLIEPEEGSDICVSEAKAILIPSTVRTLAQIREQIQLNKQKRELKLMAATSGSDDADVSMDCDIEADKRRKRFKRLAASNRSDCAYASNIDKIVHELKSIGHHPTAPTTADTETENKALKQKQAEQERQKKLANRQKLRLLRSLLSNKRKLRSLFIFKPTKLSSFLTSLVKQQQYRQLLNKSETEASKCPVDVSIVNDNQLLNIEQEPTGEVSSQQQLPGIVSLINVAATNKPTSRIDLYKKMLNSNTMANGTSSSISAVSAQNTFITPKHRNPHELATLPKPLELTRPMGMVETMRQVGPNINQPIRSEDMLGHTYENNNYSANSKYPLSNQYSYGSSNHAYQNSPNPSGASYNVSAAASNQMPQPSMYHKPNQQTLPNAMQTPYPQPMPNTTGPNPQALQAPHGSYPNMNQPHMTQLHHQPKHGNMKPPAANPYQQMQANNPHLGYHYQQRPANHQAYQQPQQQLDYPIKSANGYNHPAPIYNSQTPRPSQMLPQRQQTMSQTFTSPYNDNANFNSMSSTSPQKSNQIIHPPINSPNRNHSLPGPAVVDLTKPNTPTLATSTKSSKPRKEKESKQEKLPTIKQQLPQTQTSLATPVLSEKPASPKPTETTSTPQLQSQPQPTIPPAIPTITTTPSVTPPPPAPTSIPSTSSSPNPTAAAPTTSTNSTNSAQQNKNRSTQHQLTVAQLLSQNRQKKSPSKSDPEPDSLTTTAPKTSSIATTPEQRASPIPTQNTMAPPKLLTDSTSPVPPVLKLSKPSEVELITNNIRLSSASPSCSSASSSPITFGTEPSKTTISTKFNQTNRSSSPSSFKPIQTNINLATVTPNGANNISIRNVTSSPVNSQLGSAFNNTQQVAKAISEPLSIQSKDHQNDQTESDKQSADIDVANPIKQVKESSNTDGQGEVKVAEVENKEAHVCTGSHEAMLECQVCGLFCHASCVSNDKISSVKMCAVCLSKRDSKANGNGHGNMPRIQEMASDEDERHDNLANLECDTTGGEEEEDEGMESKADRRCATSGANSTKLNEVLSS